MPHQGVKATMHPRHVQCRERNPSGHIFHFQHNEEVCLVQCFLVTTFPISSIVKRSVLFHVFW